MSDTPETSAPALQAGESNGAAPADTAGSMPNSIDAVGAPAQAAPVDDPDAKAAAALGGTAPDLDHAAPKVLGGDVMFIDGKPTGVTLTDGVNTATGANVGEAIDNLNAQTQPAPTTEDATSITAASAVANDPASGAPATDEDASAPTVSPPPVEAPHSIMQKLEAILMPRGGVVEHTVEDLEHVCSWFHTELAKAKAAVAGAEAAVVAAGRVTLAEGRALLAESPWVASVEVIEGTLHRVGGLVLRAL